MGNLKGTQVNKIDGGNGRLSSTNDSVVLLVCAMAVAGTTLVADEAVKLIQTKDIEVFGVNESYDANNGSLAHYQTSEIFRLAPEATVYFLPVALGSDVADHTALVINTIKENPQIKGLGYAGFTHTLTEISDSVENLQITLVEELKKDGIDVDFVLVEAGSSALTLNNLPNLRSLDAQNVSIVLGNDLGIASIDASYSNHSAIGSALGMICIRQVSENIGSTDILNKPDDKKGNQLYPLTESGLNRFITAGLSTGQKISELTNTQIQSLVTNGYIFVAPYNGSADLFFSGSATCTIASSDYAYIENNRVWNKASRLIKDALMPQIKSKVKKDPETGFIRSTTISHWERLCMKACVERMEGENDISGGEITINPNQAPNEETPLKIKATIVADDIVHSFDVDLSLTNKLN